MVFAFPLYSCLYPKLAAFYGLHDDTLDFLWAALGMPLMGISAAAGTAKRLNLISSGTCS